MSLPIRPMTTAQNAAKNIVRYEMKGAVKEAISSVRDKKRSVAKQRSDAIYNERRKAKRLVARLESQAPLQSLEERKATRQYINYIKREIEKTYAPRKGTRRAEERQSTAVANLKKVTSFSADKAMRREAIYQHQLSLASKGYRTVFGSAEVSRGKFKIFMRQTQMIWEGLPNEVRLEAIRAAYGYVPIEDIFNAVMEANSEAVEALEANVKEFETTDENIFYYGEEEFNQQAGSPDYLDFVNSRVFIAL